MIEYSGVDLTIALLSLSLMLELRPLNMYSLFRCPRAIAFRFLICCVIPCVFMSSPSTVPFVSYLSSSSPSISMVSVRCLRMGIILNLSECLCFSFFFVVV